MESKASVPSSCPLACRLPADVIDMAEESNGIVATAVISRAKWARVGPRLPVLECTRSKKIASSKLHCMATNIDLWPEIYVYMCILSLLHQLMNTK